MVSTTNDIYAPMTKQISTVEDKLYAEKVLAQFIPEGEKYVVLS